MKIPATHFAVQEKAEKMTSHSFGRGTAIPATGERRLGSDDVRRLMRALNTLRAANRALVKAADEAALLQETCRVIVEESGYRLAWASFAEHDEQKSIRPVAYAGYEEGWLGTLRNTWADCERGRGPTGTAIRSGAPQVVRNVLTEANYAPWREDAQKRGYASVASLPLRVEGAVVGALSIYAAEEDAFDDEELGLLIQTAEDLGYGIAALRARQQASLAEETIQHMAFHDAQTSLPNRSLLRRLLAEAIDRARQANKSLSLIMVGLGKFHEINEALGYVEGDKLLAEVAGRIRGVLQPGSTPARIAEDQFAILVPHGGAEHATGVAASLRAALAERISLAGFMIEPRINIGIALFPGHGADADTLIRCANMALFQAERARQGDMIYSEALARDIGRRVMLVGGLQRAIDNDELRLYCQPKVRTGDRSICGAEALVRWEHPEQGIIVPNEFVRLAEHSGLMTPLTYWVLEAALRQIYAWRDLGVRRSLAVNLSACDLRDAKLIDHIKGSFATWATEPEDIQFELTESVLMEDPAGSLAILGQLKDLGVKLSIDDFGTGYSSLSYLQRLPVDSVKIDQCFVSRIATDRDSENIVRCAAELAHNLGLEVVAEGVEDEATWTRVGQLGCEVAQGYWIGKPMPSEQFGAWQHASPWLEIPAAAADSERH